MQHISKGEQIGDMILIRFFHVYFQLDNKLSN